MRHYIVHTRRAGHVVTRPLNCGVRRHVGVSARSDIGTCGDAVNVGRALIRLIVAWIAAGIVTGALFFVIAWATGQLSSGIHSNAAFVLLLFPVLLGIVFWLLVRADFPESSASVR